MFQKGQTCLTQSFEATEKWSRVGKYGLRVGLRLRPRAHHSFPGGEMEPWTEGVA